jgi:SAM-dependent methyltransferase
VYVKTIANVGLGQVQGVYSGPEGELWRLIMGHQIHLGGMESSQDLANRAQIQKGSSGVDFCCCIGGGMRFLVRFRDVAQMTGVDATRKVVEDGRRLCTEEGLADRITFVEGDVTASGLPSASADFVWGEDAWCYVEHKEKMIAEAARIVRPGGVIAFTDWVEGPTGMSQAEAVRFLSFMKFPNISDIGCYSRMLGAHGCTVLEAHDTGRFAPCVDLYLNMLQRQLTYDALRIIGFNEQLLGQLGAELSFTQEMAWTGKIVQGLFVARKN